jgi:hypothetical protein
MRAMLKKFQHNSKGYVRIPNLKSWERREIGEHKTEESSLPRQDLGVDNRNVLEVPPEQIKQSRKPFPKGINILEFKLVVPTTK